jgi:hypothetical protein
MNACHPSEPQYWVRIQKSAKWGHVNANLSSEAGALEERSPGEHRFSQSTSDGKVLMCV